MSDREYRTRGRFVAQVSYETWAGQFLAGVISVFDISHGYTYIDPMNADAVSLRGDMSAVGSDLYAVIAHAQNQQRRTGTNT